MKDIKLAKLKYMHSWDTILPSGTIWYHCAWVYASSTVLKNHTAKLISDWCFENFGVSGHTGTWVDNAKFGEISFLDDNQRNWFLLKWA